ncbi:TPA: 23S rRNA methyltransferase attenuation leader peptide, partial [Enterococcus faecium]|nr:23S rRNA methyltransferase attenuation leader peptide [Enterococcus faecium]HAY1717774.1 23S rRNA methyltransferase attenuation leader peptide [Enterococcus faecium]HAY3095612.1 23S rRNA methyltransferase attenuation leader peptide [Enterococcus faecium]
MLVFQMRYVDKTSTV